MEDAFSSHHPSEETFSFSFHKDFTKDWERASHPHDNLCNTLVKMVYF